LPDWNYCPGCGTKLERELEHAAETAEHETESQTEEITDAAVEIARIEANRDVTIAKVQAGIVEHTAEVEQAAELAHAEGKAEGLETAIAPPEPPPAEPVVVVDNNDEPEPSIPPAEPEEHHERKAPAKHGFF
jgi:hypothetical protein